MHDQESDDRCHRKGAGESIVALATATSEVMPDVAKSGTEGVSESRERHAEVAARRLPSAVGRPRQGGMRLAGRPHAMAFRTAVTIVFAWRALPLRSVGLEFGIRQ